MGDAQTDFWIFAYGSLMWAPGFPVAERLPLQLEGWHRRFSLISPRSWGTPERPGLCAALHEGGRCDGFGLRVEARHAREVRCSLERREAAYLFRDVALNTAEGRRIEALTFIWDPAEPRFRPHLTTAEAAAVILSSAPGRTGRCEDYLVRTIKVLETAGLKAPPERALLTEIERRFAATD